MSDTRQPPGGHDFDNEAFAEFLRDFADGIDNGTVLLQELGEDHTVDATDVAVASFSVQYIPKEEAFITPLEYDMEDDN